MERHVTTRAVQFLSEALEALSHTLAAIAEQPRNGDWVVEKLEEAGVPIGGKEE